MTSRGVTSGFDFWSYGHLHLAVMHLLMTSRELTSGWLLVTWSSPRRRDASSHMIWSKISLSSPKLLTFSRNSRWRPPPSWIFSLCEFGHSSVLVVWYLCSVPNLVQIFCYSHWDRRTYGSDLHLMTSRELTSGLNFWSRGHLCMTLVRLPLKFGAYIFIQSGVIDIFPKLKMAAAAILELLGWAMGPPTKPHSWRVPPVKILSWSAK